MKHFLSALVITGTLGFLVWYAHRHAADLPVLPWREPSFWTGLALAFGLYVIAAILTALNWRLLLRGLGDRSPPGVAESVLLMTQVAKYLPGNVAHFAGRLLVAKSRGIAVGTAGASLVCEQALMVVGAALYVAGGFLLIPDAVLPLAPYLPATPWLVALILCAALVPLFAGTAAAWVGQRLPERLQSSLNALRNLSVARTVGLILVQWAGFSVLGAAVVAVADAVSGPTILTLAPAAIVFVGAWVLGFITPGAPAGLGVRETVMVVGFAPLVGEGTALTMAVTLRVLSVAGDGAAFLIGFAGDRLLAGRRVAHSS